ncbi:hypothetical protein DQ04_01381010 [Trypanosoma grayi]|uniref:hypothetical protein n=1 Tax=Trypanosoma grayi TaxID=71804 RepID=UPI0004F4A153|nr:hypothetical protein DQ04_01381010 [Trypanosoma grayi]KEG12845.1 hypothetical protein DQ04_01381010 [Trypanosoma grayi]
MEDAGTAALRDDSRAVTSKQQQLELSFDFATEDGVEPIPVHEIEMRQATSRRHGNVPPDVSQQEFARLLGISVEETRDPVTKASCLDYTAALRAYYGDPDDEAYEMFRENMMRYSSSDRWLKGNNFLGKDVLEDYRRLKLFEDEALQFLPLGDKAAAVAMEAEVYGEVRSEAHNESMRRYREEHIPNLVEKRLSFERRRRAAANRACEVSEDESLPQRQCRGMRYKKAFLGNVSKDN